MMRFGATLALMVPVHARHPMGLPAARFTPLTGWVAGPRQP